MAEAAGSIRLRTTVIDHDEFQPSIVTYLHVHWADVLALVVHLCVCQVGGTAQHLQTKRRERG